MVNPARTSHQRPPQRSTRDCHPHRHPPPEGRNGRRDVWTCPAEVVEAQRRGGTSTHHQRARRRPRMTYHQLPAFSLSASRSRLRGVGGAPRACVTERVAGRGGSVQWRAGRLILRLCGGVGEVGRIHRGSRTPSEGRRIASASVMESTGIDAGNVRPKSGVEPVGEAGTSGSAHGRRGGVMEPDEGLSLGDRRGPPRGLSGRLDVSGDRRWFAPSPAALGSTRVARWGRASAPRDHPGRVDVLHG
jgi:hypothetical protein